MKTDSQKRVYRLEVSLILQAKETSSRVYFRHHTRNGLKTDHSSMIFYKKIRTTKTHFNILYLPFDFQIILLHKEMNI